jgi:hypothetical protein
VPVDDGDVDVLVLQPLGGREPSEAGSDDDDLRSICHMSIVAAKTASTSGD